VNGVTESWGGKEQSGLLKLGIPKFGEPAREKKKSGKAGGGRSPEPRHGGSATSKVAVRDPRQGQSWEGGERVSTRFLRLRPSEEIEIQE